LPRQSERAADRVARRDRDCHDSHDAQEQGGPDRQDQPDAEQGAEQHHRDLEQRLARERDPGRPGGSGSPRHSEQHPEQDRNHKSVEMRASEQRLLGALRPEGEGRDGEACRHAGQEPDGAAG
jgi:hypothetical protein